jgi:pSer/pThr/pTyr-binding forkhead associated (FHA) protein
MVGRARGAILFPDDPFVSPHHATFLLREGRLYIRDESSVSGVFVAVREQPLRAGSCFAAGQRLFRYLGPLAAPARREPGQPLVYGAPVPGASLHGVEEVIVGGRSGRAVVSGEALLTIGQQQCDLSYPGDPTLAMRHCELAPQGATALLRDVSGGLGTQVRLEAGVERPLAAGDRVRIGMQLMQVEAVA